MLLLLTSLAGGQPYATQESNRYDVDLLNRTTGFEAHVNVSVPEGHSVFVVITEEEDETVVGASRLLNGSNPGALDDVPVRLDIQEEGSYVLRATLYEDTNANGSFDSGVDKPVVRMGNNVTDVEELQFSIVTTTKSHESCAEDPACDPGSSTTSPGSTTVSTTNSSNPTAPTASTPRTTETTETPGQPGFGPFVALVAIVVSVFLTVRGLR